MGADRPGLSLHAMDLHRNLHHRGDVFVTTRQEDPPREAFAHVGAHHASAGVHEEPARFRGGDVRGTLGLFVALHHDVGTFPTDGGGDLPQHGGAILAFFAAPVTTPKGRLNRQELGWLLTQEAQGAAERLRKGVQVLLTNVPPAPEPGDGGVDQTLDALDDAMRLLSSLHQRPVIVRGRRGRIDLAALLWEVAPDARVSLEPGSGTEVFGEEGELRRMLHVLVGPGSRAGSAVTIRREGDEVKLSVVLGPDSSITSDTERAWLARMAIRYGGRYELEGGMEILSLPADNAQERQEREELRKELHEARKQGEAYARELAAITGHGEDSVAPSSMPPGTLASLDRFLTQARIAGGVAAELRGLLSPVGWDLLSLRTAGDAVAAAVESATGEKLEAIQRRLVQVQDLIGELAAVGELDATEVATEVDLLDLTRSVVKAAQLRADRAGIELRLVHEPEGGEARLLTRATVRGTMVALRELLVHAIAATARRKVTLSSPGGEGGGVVTITVTTLPEGGARITVDDAGAALPAPARRPLLALELEPGTYGRPSSLPLYFAATLAAAQGAAFTLDDAPQGGVRAALTFARG